MGYSYRFTDLDFDFSDKNYINHYDFMLSEFFKANLVVKNKFRNAYLKEYGIGPYNHMMRNFWYDWENGSRVVSDTQGYRIFKLMVNLLDDSARHRLGMNEFLMSIKSTVKSFLRSQNNSYSKTKISVSPKEITEMFQNELNEIHSLQLVDIKSRILTNEEKQEALEISKYILEIKLQKSFDQIERDFGVFLPFMLRFKRGNLSANYSILLFNLKFDIKDKYNNIIDIPRFRIREIEANSRFKEYSDKYLAYELVSIHKDANNAVSNSLLNTTDISMFFDYYEKLSNGESEISMNSTFQGEGGVLSLKAEMKPFKLLITSIMVSSVKLVIYIFLIIMVVSLAINYELFALLVLCGFFAGIFALSIVIEEFKQLISLTRELKSYGK